MAVFIEMGHENIKKPGQIEMKLPTLVTMEMRYEILLLGQINMQASFHK